MTGRLASFARALGLRRGERRETFVAVSVLAAFVAGHAVLETARDTLFLTGLSAEKLPWAYLAIAFLALALTTVSRSWMPKKSHRRVLVATLLVGAVGTGAWWLFADTESFGAVFGLYVWTGVLSTVVIIRFWIHLAASFDVSQARRSFALVGAGGLAGATLGSVAARGVLALNPPRDLLLLAAGLFALACALATRLGQASPSPRKPKHTAPVDGYVWRLFAVVLAITVLVTVGDYAFKSTVSATTQGTALGSFFATYHAITNVIALGLSLAVAPRLLQRTGVNVTLAVLPLLLLGLSLGFAAAPGLLAIVAFKATDDVLRHSLHRSSTEILFLPLSDGAREHAKSFVEAMGMRGGQALASLALLVAFYFGADGQDVAWMLVGTGVVAALSLVGMKGLYVARFRARLSGGRLEPRQVLGDLDLHSLEALVGALSSSDEGEVIAALDLFDAHGRSALVPALVLYHPSEEVVLHALRQFRRAGREDVKDAVERLLQHDSAEVRAEALSYEHLGARSLEDLDEHLSDVTSSPRYGARASGGARTKRRVRRSAAAIAGWQRR